MAKERLDSIFQVKDSYLELHDTEQFLAVAEEFRKEPISIVDAIFRNTSYDPYYHKNIFNKSQTYHHEDFIIHEIEEPITRPEITEPYVRSNPTGTKTFFPSFLRGSFVDVEKKERIFESLLLRDIQPSPTEEEIIRGLDKACKDEEQTIAFYQNEIQDRIASLADKNPNLENTFKNYFKNLCIWMITGELKENMNDRVLSNEYGIIKGPEYNFAAIPNLDRIHTKIQELHRTFDINSVLKTTNKEMNTDQIETVKKRKEELEKTLQREELLKRLKEQRKKAQQEARLASEKKKKELGERKVEYKIKIKFIGETFTDLFLNELKNKSIEVDSVNVSWNTFVGAELDIEKALKTNFLDTLQTRMPEIVTLRKQLKELYVFLLEKQKTINIQINQAKDIGDELKIIFAFEADQENSINKLLEFSGKLNNVMELLIKKRKKLTSYAFAMRWYEGFSEKRDKIRETFSDIKLGMAGKYGYFYYSKGILKENEVLLSYNVYDHGTFLKSIKTGPIQNVFTEEMYFYRINDSTGKEKEVEFAVKAIKRGTNTKPTLSFTLQEKKES